MGTGSQAMHRQNTSWTDFVAKTKNVGRVQPAEQLSIEVIVAISYFSATIFAFQRMQPNPLAPDKPKP
jgi:hypothetical protein